MGGGGRSKNISMKSQHWLHLTFTYEATILGSYLSPPNSYWFDSPAAQHPEWIYMEKMELHKILVIFYRTYYSPVTGAKSHTHMPYIPWIFVAEPTSESISSAVNLLSLEQRLDVFGVNFKISPPDFPVNWPRANVLGKRHKGKITPKNHPPYVSFFWGTVTDLLWLSIG